MTNEVPFIGIPVCALCCYLFLLFSLFNTKKMKSVTYFRFVLFACIAWTGGATLMRLQVTPGISFWFSISIFGLFLIPLPIYYFLFLLLDIKSQLFLKICTAITVAATVVDLFTGVIVSPPEAVTLADGSIVYQYSMSIATYLFALIEAIMLIYVVVQAYRKIHTDKTLLQKCFLLLIGTFFLFLGNFLTMIPNNVFPFDTLGGAIMAVCFACILYRQSMFELSYRIQTAGIYTIATFVIVMPLANAARNIENYLGRTNYRLGEAILIFVLLLTAWALGVIRLAWTLSDQLSHKRMKATIKKIAAFQSETASLFDEKDLFVKIVDVLQSILHNCEVAVYIKNTEEDKFLPALASGAFYGLKEREIEQICKNMESENFEDEMNYITLLKRDNQIYGFIYLKLPPREKMNYMELEQFRQVGTYASICLKNISVYQEVYQISVHDELTGLYNRAYYKTFLKKHWNHNSVQSIIYLDIDDFKLFNELYGESCGDDILKWCGKEIKKAVGDMGTVFRFGSNEFLVYLVERRKEELVELAGNIQDELMVNSEDKPKVLQPITMSIGIATYPNTALDEDELLKQAQRATFFAKRNGKNRIEVYEVGFERNEEERKSTRGYDQIAPTIYALTAAIDAKDSYTFQHSCHVSEYAILLAKAVGLKNNEIQIVKEAGLLHDIGKIGIPETILKKQGKLTEEEYEIMKSHVTNSIEMIHFLPNMSYVIPAVVTHHERYDGKGYPRGIAGEKIPLLGRILTISDSFDAMTSKRSYKDEMSLEYAIEELKRNKGTQFDSELVDVFIQLIHDGKINV